MWDCQNSELWSLCNEASNYRGIPQKDRNVDKTSEDTNNQEKQGGKKKKTEILRSTTTFRVDSRGVQHGKYFPGGSFHKKLEPNIDTKIL